MASDIQPATSTGALWIHIYGDFAVCVTGLVTITPAAQFTIFGKVILLFLIPDRRTGRNCVCHRIF